MAGRSLAGAFVISPAVGYSVRIGAIRPLTIHWDGSIWREVPASDAGSDNTQFIADRHETGGLGCGIPQTGLCGRF